MVYTTSLLFSLFTVQLSHFRMERKLLRKYSLKLWHEYIQITQMLGMPCRVIARICIDHSRLSSVQNISQIESSWGQHGAHLGPVGPRWAPCWPHKPCYQGCLCKSHKPQNEDNSCLLAHNSLLLCIDKHVKLIHNKMFDSKLYPTIHIWDW